MGPVSVSEVSTSTSAERGLSQRMADSNERHHSCLMITEKNWDPGEPIPSNTVLARDPVKLRVRKSGEVSQEPLERLRSDLWQVRSKAQIEDVKSEKRKKNLTIKKV